MVCAGGPACIPFFTRLPREGFSTPLPLVVAVCCQPGPWEAVFLGLLPVPVPAVTSRRFSPGLGDQLQVPWLLGWRVSKQTSLLRGLCGQTSCRVPAGSQRQLAVPVLVDFLLGNGKGRQERGVFGERHPQPEFGRSRGLEKALLGALAWGGWAPRPSLTPLPSAAAAAASAHFSFCRSLLEHTVSAENLSYRLQRNPGSSLTWHDGRSQRPDGGRTVKLLRQPGTEGSQVPTPHPGMPRGTQLPVSARPPQQQLLFPCRIRPSGVVWLTVLMIAGRLVIVAYINIIRCFCQAWCCTGVSSLCHLPSVHHLSWDLIPLCIKYARTKFLIMP